MKTTTTETHTAVPWRVYENEIRADGDLRTIVATLSEPPVPYSAAVMQANAELICRAVNSHDALLAALAEVCEQHDALLTAHGKPFGWGRLITDNARAAIAAGKAVQS